MHSLLEVMLNKVEFTFKDSPKAAGQLEECSYSKVMQSILNERTFKYNFGVGRFHMLPQSFRFAHCFFLNNFLQVWLIGNKIYQVPLSRYINWDGDLSHLVRGRKVPGDKKY